jgi:hypothetical protein
MKALKMEVVLSSKTTLDIVMYQCHGVTSNKTVIQTLTIVKISISYNSERQYFTYKIFWQRIHNTQMALGCINLDKTFS